MTFPGPWSPPEGPETPNLTVAAAVAASTSRDGDPTAFGTTRSTPASLATTRKYTRTAANREPIHRHQPHRPAPEPQRDPAVAVPTARATSAAPITSAAPPATTMTGISTCVTRHPTQRPRRGRNEPTPRTPHGQA